MKILLLGEYSRLHNTLKEGLISLGHNVVLIGDGDGFKNFPADIDIKPSITNKHVGKWIKKGLFKIFKFDLSELEKGVRLLSNMKHLKNFEVVQLINERPIKTLPFLERFLLKKIFNKNRSIYLLSCGIDSINVEFMLQNKLKYSLMEPYFNIKKSKKEYRYILNYRKKQHIKTQQFVFKNINGVIATDFDYAIPLENHRQFSGLIPNPINCDVIQFKNLKIEKEIIIFLGINRGTYYKKGISFFERALTNIKNKYDKKIKIIVVENIPYKKYVKLYEEAHILLDQVYSYDQGYNALEAMAHGKVVFTGAETEFLNYYKLNENGVCLNALPNVTSITEKLSWLIENPEKIIEIGKKARNFIEKEHHYKSIAELYLRKYTSSS